MHASSGLLHSSAGCTGWQIRAKHRSGHVRVEAMSKSLCTPLEGWSELGGGGTRCLVESMRGEKWTVDSGRWAGRQEISDLKSQISDLDLRYGLPEQGNYLTLLGVSYWSMDDGFWVRTPWARELLITTLCCQAGELGSFGYLVDRGGFLELSGSRFVASGRGEFMLEFACFIWAVDGGDRGSSYAPVTQIGGISAPCG